jgi:hypothetical protein
MAITEATDNRYMDDMLDGDGDPAGEVPTSGSHRTMSWGGSKEVRDMRGGGGEPVKSDEG